jgi:hypothetical protein
MRYWMLSLLMLAFVAIVGCGDDSTTNNTSSGPMSAKVDGSAWSPGTVTPQSFGGSLIIVGAEINGATNRQINMTITGAAVGEFQLGGVNGGVGRTLTYAEGSGTTVKTFSATSGTINITEYSSSGAKGTFSATVEGASGTTGTHSITEGTFNVTF